MYVKHSQSISMFSNSELEILRLIIFVSQDALSLLAESAELSDEDGRGVAFRRAAAVLKSLPEKVTSMKQLRGLPCLGDHSLRVIKVSHQSHQLTNPLSAASSDPKVHSRFIYHSHFFRMFWRTEHRVKLSLQSSLSGTKP